MQFVDLLKLQKVKIESMRKLEEDEEEEEESGLLDQRTTLGDPHPSAALRRKEDDVKQRQKRHLIWNACLNVLYLPALFGL